MITRLNNLWLKVNENFRIPQGSPISENIFGYLHQVVQERAAYTASLVCTQQYQVKEIIVCYNQLLEENCNSFQSKNILILDGRNSIIHF